MVVSRLYTLVQLELFKKYNLKNVHTQPPERKNCEKKKKPKQQQNPSTLCHYPIIKLLAKNYNILQMQAHK